MNIYLCLVPKHIKQVLLQGEKVHVAAKKLSLVLTERVQAGMLTAYEVVALGRSPHINWTEKLSMN